MSLGIGEIIVILLVAYLVVGPEDLPKVARGIAKALRQLRALLTGWTDDIGIKEEVQDIKKQLTPEELQNLSIQKDLKDIQNELNKELKL